MKCDTIKQWLPELAGGELGRREQTLCEEHLRTCADCRTRLRELQDVLTLLHDAGQEDTALPAGFSQALHGRLLREPPPRRPLGARIMNALGGLGLDSSPRLGLAFSAALAALLLVVAAARTVGHVPSGRPSLAQAPAPFEVPAQRVAVVHFDFVANVTVENVEFEVTLPQGLAFIDNGKPMPGHTLQWTGSLASGSNPVPLAISGTKPGRYKIVAHARGAGVDVQHDVWLEVVRS